jgi:hypothetical protein
LTCIGDNPSRIKKSQTDKEIDLTELAKLIDEKKPTCICGRVLRGSGLDHWGPHENGDLIKGYKERRWIFVHCICGYDMALWKIQRELQKETTPGEVSF